jgi:hypothetical protein
VHSKNVEDHRIVGFVFFVVVGCGNEKINKSYIIGTILSIK